MNISLHFSLEEFTASSIAARKGIDNTPNQQAIDNLKRVAAVMEDVRKLLDSKPIIITSGYRNSAVNKLVGSKSNSKHVQGLACDFICPQYGTSEDIMKAIQNSNLIFDQCIMEFYNPRTGDGWVHIGLGSSPRRQILTINSYGTFSGIHV